MPASPTDWRALAADPAPGDHILFWSDGSVESDAVLELFLLGAIRRDDLLGIVLPERELGDMIDRLSAWGLEPDRLVAEGRLVTVASEDLFPRDAEDRHRIFAALAELLGTAVVRGRAGLSVLGRVAPVFFERGDRRTAEMIEGVGHASRGQARILCLYDGRRLDLRRTRDAAALVRLHTHAITGLGGGRFFAEQVSAGPAPGRGHRR